MPTETQSIMIHMHTDKKWDDAPWQLIMLQVCLISLWPLMMCLACKYFKLTISCAFTHQVLFLRYMLVNILLSIALVCLLCLPVFC